MMTAAARMPMPLDIRTLYSPTILRFRRLSPQAKPLSKTTPLSAGFDLYSAQCVEVPARGEEELSLARKSVFMFVRNIGILGFNISF